MLAVLIKNINYALKLKIKCEANINNCYMTKIILGLLNTYFRPNILEIYYSYFDSEI